MPRVPYVNQENLNPEHQDLVVSSLQPGERLNVYGAIANNPRVLEGLREFLSSLWNHAGLTDRQREIVILTATSEGGSAYEWHHHVNIGAGSGLEMDEIAALARDDRAFFSIDEQALIAYTRAVAQDRVEEQLHEALSEHFDDETVVGVTTTAVSYLALGVELETGDKFVGWDPSR